MPNKGGFSLKRLTGISAAKSRLSRKTGIPLSRSGRQAKIGRAVSGGGCLVVVAALVGVLLAACGAAASTVRPSVTPRPTATVAPSVTPRPTATRIPPTITATATRIPPTAAPVATATRIAPTTSPSRAPTAAGAPSAKRTFTCAGGCAVPPDPSCAIKGNVNSDKEKIYHTPGQRDYAKTDIKPEEGDRWFCTAAEAQAAGFRPAQR